MGPLISEREGSNPWADGVKPRRSKRSTRWRLAAGEARCGGVLRVWSSVDQIDGGDVLRVAGGLTRRVVQAVCAGVAGDDAGVEPGGGRSSEGGEKDLRCTAGAGVGRVWHLGAR